MKKKDKALAMVNAAVKQIADKGESQLLKNMPRMWYNKDIPGSPFTGDIFCHSWFNVAQQEVKMQQGSREKLQALAKYRIRMAIESMIRLLQDDLELLKEGR